MKISLNRNQYKNGEIVTILSQSPTITFNKNTQVVLSNTYEIDTSLLQDDLQNTIEDENDIPILVVDYSKLDLFSSNLTDDKANIIQDEDGNNLLLVDYNYFNVISDDKITLVFQDDTHLAFNINDLPNGTYNSYVILDTFEVISFTLVVYTAKLERPLLKPKHTLQHSTEYLKTTKLYTEALTHVFDDLWLRYKNNDGEVYEVDIPILMSHASKTWKTRKAIDHELKSNKRFATFTNYKTPCITIAYINKERDKIRDCTNRYDYTDFYDTNGNVMFKNRHPRPFNYHFRVEIWSYSQNQLEYIHEQLLPYIDEGFSITMNEFVGDQQFNRNINVLLDSMHDWDYVESYDDADNKENQLVSRLDFTFEGFQYFPVNTEDLADIIRDIKLKINTGYLARTYNNSIDAPEYELVCTGNSETLDVVLRDDIAESEISQTELIYQDGACVFTYDDYESFKNVVVSDINSSYNDYDNGLVGTKTVDETNIADGRIISYDLDSDQMVYIDNNGEVIEYQTLIDDIDIHSFYIGNAKQDILSSSGEWRIRKSVEVDGEVTYLYPNGSEEFVFVWDQRFNYTYI